MKRMVLRRKEAQYGELGLLLLPADPNSHSYCHLLDLQGIASRCTAKRSADGS